MSEPCPLYPQAESGDLSANSCHMHRSNLRNYSITSSARLSREPNGKAERLADLDFEDKIKLIGLVVDHKIAECLTVTTRASSAS